MVLRTCLPQFATLFCTVSIIYHGYGPLRNHELYDLDVQILFRNPEHNSSPFSCKNISFHLRMYLLVPIVYSETLSRTIGVPSVKLFPVQTGSHISSAPCAPSFSSEYSDKCSLILLLPRYCMLYVISLSIEQDIEMFGGVCTQLLEQQCWC